VVFEDKHSGLYVKFNLIEVFLIDQKIGWWIQIIQFEIAKRTRWLILHRWFNCLPLHVSGVWAANNIAAIVTFIKV
jgi:hypothetical protein